MQHNNKQITQAALKDAKKSADYIRTASSLPTERLLADRITINSSPVLRRLKYANLVLYKVDSLLTERGITGANKQLKHK